MNIYYAIPVRPREILVCTVHYVFWHYLEYSLKEPFTAVLIFIISISKAFDFLGWIKPLAFLTIICFFNSLRLTKLTKSIVSSHKYRSNAECPTCLCREAPQIRTVQHTAWSKQKHSRCCVQTLTINLTHFYASFWYLCISLFW